MDEYSIGDLARLSGVTPAVLRMWEQRFGFPQARRTPSGHRRFGEPDLVMVREVLAEKQRGLPLEHAVRRVVDRHDATGSRSLHSELTRRHPELVARTLRRGTLVALSRALEDECLARTDRPIVLGSFQTDTRFAPALARWQELARSSRWCVALADFAGDRPVAGPTLVSLPPDSPLLREWSVVCVSEGFHALLSAWEIPGQEGTGPDRRYEAVLSTDPRATRTAARVLAAIAVRHGATQPADVTAALVEREVVAADLLSADRLLTRAVAYLDQDLHPGTSGAAAH